MRLLIAAIVATVLALPAMAADKGGLPAKIDAKGEPKSMWTGCFIGAGGGVSMPEASSAMRAFMIGAGCDYQVGDRIVVGAGAAYSIAEAGNAVALSARLGFLPNPHLMFYGTLGVAMDGKSPSLKDNLIYAGVGLETYIAARTTIFVETTTDLHANGAWSGVGTVNTVSGGVRFRF